MIQRSWSLLASVLLAGSPAPPPTPATSAPPRDGEVRAVSLIPAAEAGRAELVIQVRGTVEVSDRTLSDPNRIVLDLAGATLAPVVGGPYADE